MKSEVFRVIVDNEEEILHAEEFLIGQKHVEESIPVEISFFIPNSNKSNESLRLIVTSDRWIMREDFIEYINLSDHNIE